MTLQAIENINLASLADSLLSLVAAFILGGLIGFERQYRQRTAGLRTNVLVAVGAALFVDIANRLNGHQGAISVMSYVVSGIGFLGAAQLDKFGNINTTVIGDYAHPKTRLPGGGELGDLDPEGMLDVIAAQRRHRLSRRRGRLGRRGRAGEGRRGGQGAHGRAGEA